jgi:hypothetical protein
MTIKQAGAILSAPQDYDDPALLKSAAQLLGRKGGLAGKGKRTADCRRAALIRWARVRAERAKIVLDNHTHAA